MVGLRRNDNMSLFPKLAGQTFLSVLSGEINAGQECPGYQILLLVSGTRPRVPLFGQTRRSAAHVFPHNNRYYVFCKFIKLLSRQTVTCM